MDCSHALNSDFGKLLGQRKKKKKGNTLLGEAMVTLYVT